MRTRLFRRHEARVERARGFLDGRGASAIFVGRFTAFLRAVTPGLAGLSGMRYRRFLAWNAAGGAGVGRRLRRRRLRRRQLLPAGRRLPRPGRCGRRGGVRGGRARRVAGGPAPGRPPTPGDDEPDARARRLLGMDADVVVVGAGLAGLAATAELADAGRRVVLVDQEPRAEPRRPGVLVLRRAVPRRQPRAAPDGDQGLPRPGPAGLVRQRPVRPPRGLLATRLGRGVRRLRSRREAVLAARHGAPAVPGRRVGRARRRPRRRARQLGPALPHHLGHRARHRRAVRATGPRRRRARAGSSCGSGTASTAWSPAAAS